MMREFKFLSKADLVDEHGYHHFFDVVQQEYIDSLKAENETLKRELKQIEVQDQVVFENLREETQSSVMLLLVYGGHTP